MPKQTTDRMALSYVVGGKLLRALGMTGDTVTSISLHCDRNVSAGVLVRIERMLFAKEGEELLTILENYTLMETTEPQVLNVEYGD